MMKQLGEKLTFIYIYEIISLSYFSENHEIKNRQGFDIEDLKLNLENPKNLEKEKA